MSCWILATIPGIVELMDLSLYFAVVNGYVQLALNQAWHIQTVYGSRFLPQTLVQSLSMSRLHFYRDLHKLWCTLAVHFLDPQRNHYTSHTRFQIKGCEKSTHPLTHKKLRTQDILILLPTIALCYYNCFSNCNSGQHQSWIFLILPHII